MRYCTRCVMPSTRPGEWQKIPEAFDENGVCLACRNYDKRKEIDWDARWNELEGICDQYRGKTMEYDCLIPVSGGKDSTYLVYALKEVLGMNPLLLNITDPFTHTFAGDANLKNISNIFNCDTYIFRISEDLFRRTTKISFEELLHPLVLVEAAIYTVPLRTAIYMNIPLLVQGENPGFEYGTESEENTSSWDNHVNQIIDRAGINYWMRRGIAEDELNFLKIPSGNRPKTLFMSYFVPWNSYQHQELARRWGFRDLTHEWIREGFIENFDSIDTIGWLMAHHLKFWKFGFARSTDVACRWIREGRISRDEAIALVNTHDNILDQNVLDDFLAFTGYSVREFWDIVERFWNKDIFEKVNGVWKKKAKYQLV